MANRSKDKGTKWETENVRWLIASGYPNARRNTLGGRYDPGDIEPVPLAVPPIIISAKIGYGGKACQACNHVREVHSQTKQFGEWWFDLHETRRRRNLEALALLSLHRAGKASPEFAHWYVSSSQLRGPGEVDPSNIGAVKITGTQARALMLRYAPRETGSAPCP